jgi:ElaB/YqjD/DUF883 family membrane-anchored ribosome-binding protein
MEASADKLIRDIRVVVRDAEDLIKATSGDIGERTREARAKLAGALVVAKDSLNKVEEAALGTVQATQALVSEYPYQCVGIAFGVGLLVGVLAARR